MRALGRLVLHMKKYDYEFQLSLPTIDYFHTVAMTVGFSTAEMYLQLGNSDFKTKLRDRT